MYPKPHSELHENTKDYEMSPMVKATGFREYDARWFFGKEINLMGVQAVGMGLGTLIKRAGKTPEIVVGHDFRGYSQSIKMALITGLLATGCKVHDIGLAMSPMAYFAQFALDVPCVAMVTASHNDNGWTGVKMGYQRPVTFGPDEMNLLKTIVLDADFDTTGGGSYIFHENFEELYIKDLTNRPKFTRKMRVIAACGNGTAGAFAPQILEKLGVEVIHMDTHLDHSFPKYNPNPEDMEMLHAMSHEVKTLGADVALGFDGDGDRCGVVDNHGEEIFADKIGVMLARDLSKVHGPSQFVVDVKSTGLFMTDPELIRLGAKTDYYKTGHSYIKRRVADLNALAGFEKSGHFFFNAPVGKGYDDGVVTAIAVLDMLDRNPDKTMAELYAAVPKTWGTPTMAPKCADEIKYEVVERMVKRLSALTEISGQPVRDIVTVNGIRITAQDGTWGLVRASSNKPELVVVVESPVSEARMREMFKVVDDLLRENKEVGAYNQSI